jgi:hypothetical protein
MKLQLVLALNMAAVIFTFVKCETISQEKVKQVSNKCCPSEAVKCCTHVIEQKLSLKCDKMTPGETLTAANCIQNELFKDFNTLENFNIQDLACCDVFTRNDNDPNNTCFHHCTNSVMIVGLKPSERFKKIESCHNGNKLDTCFHICLSYLHRHKYRKNFIFSEHCLWKNRMVPGKIYVGSNVR